MLYCALQKWFCITSLKVFGARKADLTVKAKKTRLYVCRVNDQFDNAVFSEWVKLKVLDIDKSGTFCSLFAKVHTAWCLWRAAVMFKSANIIRSAGRLAG